jgi:hypothetical protein
MRTLLTLAALALSAVLAAPAAAAPRHAPYDFDDDGRQDIVAGIPAWSAYDNAVGAFALFGDAGLNRPPRVVNQSTPGVPDAPQGFDRFGSTVAGGDFDGDGFADLAVGTPYEGIGNPRRARGAVTVFRGSASGLLAPGAREIAGPGTDNARFGAGLAAGDLNRDGYADLVVGAPEDAPSARASGAMYVFFGGRAGLDAAHPRRLARPRSNDAHFGQHIALGDFDGDHRLDVAETGSGIYTEKPIRRQSAWCRGGAQGPASCDHLTRSRTPLAPVSVAAGDVTGDGKDDMVEGLVSYWRGEKGAILLRKGGGHGPRAGRVYSQSSRGVAGHSEPRDQFGRSVAIGDLDRDGHADVVVGSPGEDRSAGRIVILRGTSGGLSSHHARTLSQRDRGIPGSKGRQHYWGWNLTLLRIDRDGDLDLITDTFDRSVFEVPGGRHGLVFRRTDDFNLRRLGHRGPNDLPSWIGLGLGH